MEKSVNDGLDYSGDAAVGPFFGLDYKKHDDLKQMLDSNRDNLKLEAMKRIIGMVAKGRDASDLFPAVVKNVVSKNPEVKKLVYVYLVRYAEEQQDCALLSISTFQRALKDPNQLIRASALRVLSSIRVPMIVPIVMLAIRDASSDMSPYVRKTAAHAIPKLYSLDADQKEELVSVLDKLLADRTTLVVGSAVMAFEEVCPERIDLVHKNYRKLCALLMDVDEWGQVVIVNMLTRYARTQFIDPNVGDLSLDGEERPFYEDEDQENGKEAKDESSDDDSSGEEGQRKSNKGAGVGKKESSKQKAVMDPDHRLLLKNARPLLQSRNSSVVMAVAQLYYHLAPKMEVSVVIKALIRLLRSHTEVQAVVLSSIAAMSTNRQSLFEPYMKSFFVRSSDPTQIKLLKLEILTNIANEVNISPILREFQAYISSQDKEFVAATIQAIGRCASNIKQVAETCLNGLVSLLSHRDPAVVGGAVVVAKTLLQTQKSGTKPVIAQLAKMVDRVTVAPARAAILWLLGEHCERLPHLPPDVLRKMAKTFPDEEDIVKLQIINLAAKLQLTNPSQTTLLCQYVLNLAKYDQSYDIRDRARFIRHLLFPENVESKLSKYARKILLSSKPAPVLQSKFKDREQFQLGSLSHFLNNRATGYQDLPYFPEEAPDPSVRNVEPPESSSVSNNDTATEFGLDFTGTSKKGKKKQSRKRSSFYSDTEESEGKSEGTKSGSSSSGSGSGTSSSSSGSESGSSSGTDDSDIDSTDSGSGDSQDAGNSDREKNGNEKLSSSKLKKDTGGKGSGPGDKRNVKDSQPDRKKVIRYKKEKDSDSEGESGSSNSSPEVDESSSSEEENIQSKKPLPNNAMSKQKSKAGNVKRDAKGKGKNGESTSNVEMLLDFSPDSSLPTENLAPGLMSSLSAGIMTPNASSSSHPSTATVSMGSIQSASPMFIPTKRSELLNKIASGGLQISSRFTRAPHLFSQSMGSIELLVQNLGKEVLKNIRVGQKSLPSGMSVHDFNPIEMIEPGKSVEVTLGVDFHDTTQGAKMEILWETEVESKKQSVTINAPIGELIRPVTMSESLFIAEQGKLRGMNEHEGRTFVNKTLVPTTTTTSRQSLVHRVYETANLLQVPSTEDHLVRFAGQCLSSQTLVLVTIHLTEEENISQDEDLPARMVVNCEKMVVGSILLQELKEALKIGLN